MKTTELFFSPPQTIAFEAWLNILTTRHVRTEWSQTNYDLCMSRLMALHPSNLLFYSPGSVWDKL